MQYYVPLSFYLRDGFNPRPGLIRNGSPPRADVLADGGPQSAMDDAHQSNSSAPIRKAI